MEGSAYQKLKEYGQNLEEYNIDSGLDSKIPNQDSQLVQSEKEKVNSESLLKKIDKVFLGKSESRKKSKESVRTELIDLVENDDYLRYFIYSDMFLEGQYSSLKRKETNVTIDFFRKIREKAVQVEKLRQGKEKADEFRSNFEINMDDFKEYRSEKLVEEDKLEINRLENKFKIDYDVAFSGLGDNYNEKAEQMKIAKMCHYHNENHNNEKIYFNLAVSGNEKEKLKVQMMLVDNKINNDWADILEAILCEHTELSNWLGETAMSYLTSKYDDIKNGVDFYTEFEDLVGQTLAFAVDVTFSSHFDKKIRRIKKEIDHDKMAKIDYYVSDDTGFVGRKIDVPRFILAIDYEKMEELNDFWLKGDVKSLEKNSIKVLLIKLIESQSILILKYLEKLKKEGAQISKIDKMINIYTKIYNFVISLSQSLDNNENQNRKANNQARSFAEKFAKGILS